MAEFNHDLLLLKGESGEFAIDKVKKSVDWHHNICVACIFFVGFVGMLAAGTGYGFSAWSPAIKKSLAYQQSDIELVGELGNIGSYLGPLTGIMAALLPTYASCFISAFLCFFGYFVASETVRSVSGFSSFNNPLLLGLAFLCMGFGSGLLYSLALNVQVHNVPRRYTAVAVAVLVAAYGLSASIWTSVYNVFGEDHLADFLLFLASAIGVIALLCALSLRYVTRQPHALFKQSAAGTLTPVINHRHHRHHHHHHHHHRHHTPRLQPITIPAQPQEPQQATASSSSSLSSSSSSSSSSPSSPFVIGVGPPLRAGSFSSSSAGVGMDDTVLIPRRSTVSAIAPPVFEHDDDVGDVNVDKRVSRGSDVSRESAQVKSKQSDVTSSPLSQSQAYQSLKGSLVVRSVNNNSADGENVDNNHDDDDAADEVARQTLKSACIRVFFVLGYLLKSLLFHLLFIVFFCVGGSGLFYINNAGHIAQSLNNDVDDHSFVLILVLSISLANGAGRLIMASSDFLRIKRGYYLFASASMMSIAHFINAYALTEKEYMYPGAIAVGLAYGLLWSSTPVILSDLYGRRDFAMTFGWVGCAPGFASILYNELAGQFYQTHVPSGSTDCVGPICFRDIYLVAASTSGFAALICCFIIPHTRLGKKDDDDESEKKGLQNQDQDQLHHLNETMAVIADPILEEGA